MYTILLYHVVNQVDRVVLFKKHTKKKHCNVIIHSTAGQLQSLHLFYKTKRNETNTLHSTSKSQWRSLKKQANIMQYFFTSTAFIVLCLYDNISKFNNETAKIFNIL